MAEDSINADAVTRAAAAVAQAPEVDWVAFARTGAELARRALEAFLTREGLTGTSWDPEAGELVPSRTIDTETLHTLGEHERRTGQLQAIARMADRYAEAVAAGADDVDEWRADVIGAVQDYGLTGTLVDPRGPLEATQLTPTARMDQAYLADAARERIAETGGTRTETIDVALYRFADRPSVDVGQRAPQLDPSRIAAQIQSGARADLWDESDWPDRESGEELAPFVSVALRRPVQETIESRRFVEVLSYEIAEARTVGEELPEVTAANRAEALRLAPQVWDALVDRGEQLPPQPEWWRAEREQLRVESPTLQARMEQAYLDGYDERIRTGLAYDDADEAGKERVGAEVLTAKVLACDELGRLTRTLDAELPGMERFYEEGVADQPLTAAADAALERSANLAGRWAGLDAGADDLIASIDSRTLEVTHAPSVYAGDPRDALFNYLDPDAQRAQRALPQIERDNTMRAARAVTASAPAQDRAGLFERLRERRDERRVQTASLTDPGRQRTAPQQAQTIK
ncbi:hypothetical protein KZI27_00965 (plasmid) [Curtobacterium sp. TC1]|uniref:hypothetical protein n=1 Tax=Curtobacterium sp. TC1 TaxID=2862880 RepID=UPI001C9A2E63|nr:hypothetical protein [Curtobacterium sp. TC1]QZQ53746.1 hypothetical protein KZI27_00965 [Curtobacterium sp. TC1]